MIFNEAKARNWVRDNVHLLCPANTRRYSTGVIDLKLGSNMLGMQVDRQPVEGKVVHCADDFCVLKTGRTGFVVVNPEILAVSLQINSTVKITPYQRRRFDGSCFNDPVKTTVEGNFSVRSFVFGQTISDIPVQEGQTDYTKHMMDLLHRGTCPDNVRVISNMLVDFNATNVRLQEPDLDRAGHNPEFHFDCKTGKFEGHVIIGLDLGADMYYVTLQKNAGPDADNQPVAHCEAVFFDDLSTVLTDLLCDGTWKLAKVELLKAAPKVKSKELVAA